MGWVRFPSGVTSNRTIFQRGSGYSSHLRLRSLNGGTPNVSFLDDDGTNISFQPYTAFFASNTNWRHVGLIRTTNTVALWIDGASVWDGTNANIDAIATFSPIYFGESTGGTEPLGGELAEWAMWNRALSADEIAALAKGFAPTFLPNSLYWYLPMLREYQELRSGFTVTNDGSTVVAHPRIFYPSGPIIIHAPQLTGETHEFSGTGSVSMDGSLNTLNREQVFRGAETVSMDGSLGTLLRRQVFADTQSLTFDGTAALVKRAKFDGAATASFDGSLNTVLREQVFRGQQTDTFDGAAALARKYAFAGAQTVSMDGSVLFGGTSIFEGSGAVSFNGLAALSALQWENADTPTELLWTDVE